MKKANIKTAVLLLVAAMTAAACSSDDASDTTSTALPVSVTATVAGMQTRATNITTSNLADFGLYINPDVSATTWNSSQVTKASEAWTLATPITWDTEKTASVVAYAPYQTTSPITVPTTAGGAPTMTLTANTSNTSESIDWLYNYQTSVNPTAGSPLSITFQHAMSRLRVKVRLNTELTGYSVQSVEIMNTIPTGDVLMNLGVVGLPRDATAATVYATHTGETTANAWSAFLVPQTVSALQIKVTVGNGTTTHSYTYTHNSSQSFKMGTAYAITLSLDKNKVVEASTINIGAWGSGVSGSGSTEI